MLGSGNLNQGKVEERGSQTAWSKCLEFAEIQLQSMLTSAKQVVVEATAVGSKLAPEDKGLEELGWGGVG